MGNSSASGSGHNGSSCCDVRPHARVPFITTPRLRVRSLTHDELVSSKSVAFVRSLLTPAITTHLLGWKDVYTSDDKARQWLNNRQNETGNTFFVFKDHDTSSPLPSDIIPFDNHGSEVCIGIVGILPIDRKALRQRRELHQRQSERKRHRHTTTPTPTLTSTAATPIATVVINTDTNTTSTVSSDHTSSDSKRTISDSNNGDASNDDDGRAADDAWLAMNDIGDGDEDYDYEQVEIGYMLCESQWHRGYATELCRALISYVYDRYPHGLRKLATDGTRVIDVPSHDAARRTKHQPQPSSSNNTNSNSSNSNGNDSDSDASIAQAAMTDVMVWAFTQSANVASQSVLTKCGFTLDVYHSHDRAYAYCMTRQQWLRHQADRTRTAIDPGHGLIVKA